MTEAHTTKDNLPDVLPFFKFPLFFLKRCFWGGPKNKNHNYKEVIEEYSCLTWAGYKTTQTCIIKQCSICGKKQ